MNARENMELVFQHKQPDWIPHAGHDAYGFMDGFAERMLDQTGYDAWGCHWISCPDSLGITHPDTQDIKFDDVSEWREKANIPDVDALDFSSLEAAAKTFTDRDQKMVRYTSVIGIFERSHSLMGFENALCATLEDPEEFGEMLKAFADYKIKLFKKVYDICQPDILVYHDDMGSQASSIMKKEFYVKYLFPQYKRIVAECKAYGYKYILQHSCGKIDSLFPEWLDCGFDGWDSVMPCNNLPEIKAKYGDRVVFSACMDGQQVLGNKKSTRSDIEKMVVRWMNMLACDGTGLLLNSSVGISLNPANEAISLEFILKHGKPFMDAKKAGVEYQPDYE